MEPEFSQELEDAICEARRGDAASMGYLYRHFAPGLLRYLKGRIPSEAEDISSETWISIAKAIRNFKGDAGDFRAWVFSTARRRIIDHLRRGAVRPELKLVQDPDANTMPNVQFDFPGARLEVDEAVATLIAGLSDEQAEVVLLRVVGGLSAKEVAVMMSRPEGTIRVIQHRAIQKMAENLNSKTVTHEQSSAFPLSK